MNNNENLLIQRKAKWAHHPQTFGGSIPGIHIYMLCKETLWTVIRITIAYHKKSTMLTGKVFFGSLENN